MTLRQQITQTRKQREKTIRGFAKAMLNADLEAIHKHGSEYAWFTPNMEKFWREYIASSVDLYDLLNVRV